VFDMIRRGMLVFGLLAGAMYLLPAAAAQAATHPAGGISSAIQDTVAHRVTVKGWAYDPAKPAASVVVVFYVAGTFTGRVVANQVSPTVNKTYKVTGRHAYTFSFTWRKSAVSVKTGSRGIHTTGPVTILATRPVTHVAQSPGARIIAVAKRYVGKARYVEGGSTPSSGFDCSGYTAYAYAVAKVKTLPHNAEAQRRMKGMRIISAAKARPGDLVFYLGGGGAYHVAIYAGNHMQYAAATPRDGIRYQAVWSSAVQYGTVA
jgi:cell wall-associated NlpC family hydrolase